MYSPWSSHGYTSSSQREGRINDDALARSVACGGQKFNAVVAAVWDQISTIHPYLFVTQILLLFIPHLRLAQVTDW